MIVELLILFIIAYLLIHFTFIKEHFLSRLECPTRNMSYDIRGEAYFPLKRNFPFDNSVIGMPCY
jgi:hypothetical protein